MRCAATFASYTELVFYLLSYMFDEQLLLLLKEGIVQHHVHNVAASKQKTTTNVI